MAAWAAGAFPCPCAGDFLRRSDQCTAANARYFHKDHLGSTVTITDESGAVVEHLAYDSWGKRRHPNGNDDLTNAIASLTNRGFTGHEHLQAVALVHMNGRVYDPLLARFISADPFIQDPFNTQSLNRYSYVLNNPLAYTDPNGFFFKKILMAHVRPGGLGTYSIPGLTGAIDRFMAANAWARTANQVIATAVASYFGLGPVAAMATAAYNAGVTGGSAGDMVKAGAIAYATAVAFEVVGDATGGHLVDGQYVGGGNTPLTPEEYFGSARHIANIAGHAAVGCASSAAQGGSCSSGALSAAPGALAGPKLADMTFAEGVVAHAVIGGTGSVLGGGKFENGAVTAAYGYLFNEMGDLIRAGAEPISAEYDAGYITFDANNGVAEPTIGPLDILGVGRAVVSSASSVGKGLTGPGTYFGKKSYDEIFDVFSKKFGPPRSSRNGADTFYNPRTQRSFNVHDEPGHGGPHVDIRRRGNYSERDYDLRKD